MCGKSFPFIVRQFKNHRDGEGSKLGRPASENVDQVGSWLSKQVRNRITEYLGDSPVTSACVHGGQVPQPAGNRLITAPCDKGKQQALESGSVSSFPNRRDDFRYTALLRKCHSLVKTLRRLE